ncbi:NUDIX domain-containing protein [Planococcus sp. YIM B11945]|uniref:NUDIX domain-containing protein n=1 Tax=Planococcus sp. YIM B11945 TaxID=3435410 RepID=UPI003D7DCC65
MAQNYPRHIVAVSAYVLNAHGEALLVKTHFRQDTWEAPGGQVEEGEALDEAVKREVLEETGIAIKPLGVTGVYYNQSRSILSVVFKAECLAGEIALQPEEIKEACFVKLTEENLGDWITRPHMKSRTLDAMNAKHFVPYETWETSPFRLTGRLDEEFETTLFSAE